MTNRTNEVSGPGGAAPGPTAAPGPAARCLRALHAAVKSVGLAGAESRTHRECVVAACIAEIRARLSLAGGLSLRIRTEGFELDGRLLPATAATLELRSILGQAGLRCLHVGPGVEDPELRGLLQVLGTHGSGRDLPDRTGAALPGLLTCSRRDVHVSVAAGRTGRRGSWDVEIGGEERRVLALDLGRVLLDDLGSMPPTAPYRDRIVALLSRLVVRLVRRRQLAPATLLLALVEEPGRLTVPEAARIHAALDAAHAPAFLRAMAGRLQPRPEAACDRLRDWVRAAETTVSRAERDLGRGCLAILEAGRRR